MLRHPGGALACRRSTPRLIAPVPPPGADGGEDPRRRCSIDFVDVVRPGHERPKLVGQRLRRHGRGHGHGRGWLVGRCGVVRAGRHDGNRDDGGGRGRGSNEDRPPATAGRPVRRHRFVRRQLDRDHSFFDAAPQRVEVDGTLLTIDVVEVGAELISYRSTHNCTPNDLRSRASPRSEWVCTVDFVVPNNSATSLNVHS